MKKALLIVTLVISLFMVAGCTRPRKSAANFKKEYESVNGKEIREGITYRTLDIDKNNPYVKVTPGEIVQKIMNGETFYLYVGDHLCPWCRSGLEKMIEVAEEAGIKDIYYIDFWDDNHVEILRDLYEVQTVNKKEKVVKTKSATTDYTLILTAVKYFAQDYTLTKDGKVYDVGEKRILGGDHFYFENGICKKYVTLRSSKLDKSNGELTPEVLADQEKNFKEFFGVTNSCDDNC